MPSDKIPTIDIKKYGGKQVALHEGRIVASGTDTEEVLEAALRNVPGATWRDITLITVPKSLDVVYGA